MAQLPELLVRGPWRPDQIHVRWRTDVFEPTPGETAIADGAIDALRQRGSPSHDGLAARLADYQAAAGELILDLQPARWALRLNPDRAAGALSALCIVRDAEGAWLAGRRAGWLATWPGRWALGAAGSVEVDEHPAQTMVRELAEEWSVQAQQLRVEALIRGPSGATMLLGQAWLAAGATVVADHEHDDFAWLPPEVDAWPPYADAPLREIALLLSR